MNRIKVGILGATGMAGQRYIQLLENHPWFEVGFLAASQRSAGKAYSEAVAGRWLMDTVIPASVTQLEVHGVENLKEAKSQSGLIFSALDSTTAHQWEPKYAQSGFGVISNASAFRSDPDVPVVIPEVNSHHLDVLRIQQRKRGWDQGFIVTKPNCSLQSYLIPLFILHKKFTLKSVVVTTLQAVSGAGHPGVSSNTILDNSIPYIPGEESKSEEEPRKILGTLTDNGIQSNQSFKIAAHCNRVPTLDGHLACVSAAFETRPELPEVLKLWDEFKALPQDLSLPMAPIKPVVYHEQEDRPQPRFDRMHDQGMAINLGRLRQCPVLHIRFVGLSHNTIRGASGGGILIAELLVQQGVIKS